MNMLNQIRRIGIAVCALALLNLVGSRARADIVLDFSEIPAGTLLEFSPFTTQGFMLTSTSGGFVVNSSDTGNGSPQTPGSNPFYAGAIGLAAFSPATITLAQTDSTAFSLLSINVARNFAFDAAPSVTLTGTLAGGGTVSETLDVTLGSPPLAFQTFTLTGFENVTSVSWDQGAPGQGIHQFGNIHVTVAVPEPSTLVVSLMGAALVSIAPLIRPRRASRSA